MRNTSRTRSTLVGCVLLFSANWLAAQDWPQWRGPNRDNKVVGFTAPATWPKELTKKWQVTVGLGDASPALVGDKVYVFTRQGGDEVISCLDASTGKEVWKNKYSAPAFTGADSRDHLGPRSTPAVAEGKVCTLGVLGKLSCLDASTGKFVWQKDSPGFPRFHTASSPIIVEGKCIALLGTDGKGALTAFDLANGEAKWSWTGETGQGAAYGSPVLATIEGTKQLVTLTAISVVGIGLADGKLLWQITPAAGGKGYVSNTPIVDGQTVIYIRPGMGTVAAKIEKQGDAFTAKQLWSKTQPTTQFTTPVLKEGLLYGLTSSGSFYCMNAQTGDVLWTDSARRGDPAAILDVGPVLLAQTSNSELAAFKPSNKEYTELAKIKIAANTPWAYPIIAGNRVFVKDRDSLTLWTIP